ncbi:MAG: hypothetical protein ACOCRX_09060 [Candidatus Woesearchaeota archaeon]
MGTSKAYTPPTGNLWTSAKRGVTNMIKQKASTESIGKALKKHIRASRSNSTSFSNKNKTISSSAGRALNFISDVQNVGLDEALDDHGLNNLVGKNFNDIFVGLVDYFTDGYGTINEIIARDSIAELLNEYLSNEEDIEAQLNNININKLIEDYIIKCIQKDFMNHYSEKILSQCENINETISIQDKIKDFIRMVVEENYFIEGLDTVNWNTQKGEEKIKEIHNKTLDIFLMWGDTLG